MILPFDRPTPLAPPPEYARLRDTTPVAPVQTPDGRRAWLVTSYDAVAAVLSDRRFRLAPPGSAYPGNDTLFQDGEAHARLRRLVSKAFGPRTVEGMRVRVEQVADERVAALAANGPPADLVAGLAAPLSITVMGELLGVDPGDREHVRELAGAGGTDFVFGDEEEVARAAQAWEGLTSYAATLVGVRRAAPGDDLLSSLIGVRDAEDGRLSDGELVAMVATIVAAGYLSARNAISTAVLRLLAEGEAARVASTGLGDAAGPRLDAVVEEVLRLQSGLTGEPFPRFAQTDLDLAGVPIRAGDLVLVRLEAAHRDPRHFAGPDTFAPGRSSSPSLVFGHGVHYCLGAPLARLEVGAALAALARRLPGLRLAGTVDDIAWAHDGADRGPAALPVLW
ncbi:cytochrome P450 [Nonomuraea gerenzanensis]|uniref:Putative cytochrome P450 hydroxylase n=1 Tax=Nonomuraea gerenzanensis TaxID=93944 RepID=A0A1M4EAL6_9ACTN|nr:cytochrome P450 [Nonomuraea gerenzanensis]UBU18106.1 cytochrome P450 [Nonomuraea gerenzanensis]SBO95915.1 putative cytochrome P450 hydroxylase [Nonomuraea gerenzanensis]